ncbi:MAG: glutathione S-transferase family protein [Candidatus Devosia phytovorans]|uniref:Glutathione S-transferase family protein n=1 Tax=Candidatus Devosia phytovorans TaxID=3121372 RepID=A0AAJ5VV66_9HYPH|nr:glutathione S-transferase family protein [Devosia sp.]WEK04681.1 MAG: glutathione S-transferase family protein [Devosia sp.]
MLTLYIHPLASFCHKVLIALYENETPFEAVTVNFADPGSAAAHIERWPVGKIPVLHDSDGDRIIAETSIIIEYLQLNHPGPLPMLPADAASQLQVRLWDRFFDLYVSQPMQKIVTDRIRPADAHDPFGVNEARGMLEQAYGMIENQMRGRACAASDCFSMADCAAFPALFFATIVHPFSPEHGAISEYLARLLERPSIRRVLREAQPYFGMFPYRAEMPQRFLGDFS